MSDLIRRSDVKRDYEKHFSELSKSAVHFSLNDIFSNLDNIRSVPALELNEDLMIKLNQLDYVKVVRCKECCNRDTIGCPMYSPATERSITIDNGFCHRGDLEK